MVIITVSFIKIPRKIVRRVTGSRLCQMRNDGWKLENINPKNGKIYNGTYQSKNKEMWSSYYILLSQNSVSPDLGKILPSLIHGNNNWKFYQKPLRTVRGVAQFNQNNNSFLQWNILQQNKET